MTTQTRRGVQSRQIELASRPDGIPTEKNFSLTTATLSPIEEGEFLVRNDWMSVDPYMRGRMKQGDSYVPAFEIGEPLEGGCIGEVIESNHEGFQVGDPVLGNFGWREYWKSTGEEVQKLDADLDNVGSDHLEAAIDQMNDFGCIVCCGMISTYNATEPASAPRNLFKVIGKRLRLQGFIVRDHMADREKFVRDVSSLIRDGKITWKETITESLEKAPNAFIGLFDGDNLGKALVRISKENP